MKKAQFVHVDDNDESVGYEEDYQYDDWGVDRVDLDFKSGNLGYNRIKSSPQSSHFILQNKNLDSPVS